MRTLIPGTQILDSTIDTTDLVDGAVTDIKLSTTGVSPGVFTKITVNAQGRVSLGANPTTLAAYGITDAVQFTDPRFNVGFLSPNDETSLRPGSRKVVPIANQIVTIDHGPGAGATYEIGIANNPIIPGNASITLPSGTTAQRGTGSAGKLRFNTDTSYVEQFDTAWNALVTDTDNRLASAQTLIVSPAPGKGQFSTVSAALATITDAGPNKRYMVKVLAGSYNDTGIVLKRYVSIVGDAAISTYLFNTDPSTNLITGSNDSKVQGVTLGGSTNTGSAAVFFQDAAENASTRAMQLEDIRFAANNIDIHVKSTGQSTSLFATTCVFGGPSSYNQGVVVEASGTGAQARVFLRSSTTNGATAPLPAEFAYVTGAGAEINIIAVNARTSLTTPSGYGVRVNNGGLARLSSVVFRGFAIGVYAENAGTGPTIQCYNVGMESNTWDLFFDNPNTVGTYLGTATKSKVIDNSGKVSVLYLDPVNPGTNIIGALNIGNNAASLTNVTDLILKEPPMGLISGGVISSSGLNISITSGIGYVRNGGNGVIRVPFAAQTIAIAAGTSPYIYIDSSGTIQTALNEPSALTNIELGRCIAGASSIISYTATATNIDGFGNNVENWLRTVVGPVFISGSLVSEGTTPLSLNISAGNWQFGTVNRMPAEMLGATFLDTTRATGGAVTLIPRTTLDTDTIVGTNGPVTMTSGYFAKHVLYTDGVGAQLTFFLNHSQNQYATLQAAIDAPLDVPLISPGNTPHIAAIITQQGATNISKILDIRPKFGTQAASASGVSRHGDLSGLTADDHPQYLLGSGTRAMTGALNMGTYAITNVGLVDGVQVSLHGSRHTPNGADPIPTAAAASLNTASTSTEGIANALARSDHTHQITGFQPTTTSLTNLLALPAPGLSVRTGTDTWALRTITSSSSSLTITHGDGVGGNIDINFLPVGTPGTYVSVTTDLNGSVISGSATQNWTTITGTPTTLAGYGITNGQLLSSDLTALASIGTNGFYIRTGTGTSVTRSLIAPSQGLSITNPDGIAGSPTFALANDIGAIEALTTIGLATRIGTDQWVTRSVVQPAAGITITNGAGTAGNITIALANDLAGVEGLTTLGFAVRTATDTWATRSLSTSTLSLGLPDGVAGNPTINLPAISSAGTFNSVTIDTYGRVTAGTNPTTLSGYGITDAVNVSALGANSGVATLDSTGKLSSAQLPSLALTDTFVVASQSAQTALSAHIGDVAVRTDLNKTYILAVSPATNFANWQELLSPAAPVQSVNGMTGNVTTPQGTVTSVSGAAPPKGFTIAGSPITSSGTLTFALANSLASIEGLATFGIGARTATDTWVTRTITGGVGIVVSNGDGVSSDPTISHSTVGTAGTYKSVTTDAYGRVTAGTNPTTLAGFGINDAVNISQLSSANAPSTVVLRDSSGNFSAGTITATLNGSASSAAKLSIARTINGASFDGTANISFTTDAVVEGTTNLYFTGARASAAAPVQSVAGRTGVVTLSTSDVSEGSNLYFTSARASAAAPVQAVFGRTGSIVLNSSDVTGALGFTPVSTAALGAASGVATLDSSGKLSSGQIPSALVGAVVYQGTWNASTNTPTLTSGSGTKGQYYKVSVAGSTTVDGLNQWNAGDTIIFDGVTWDKIDGVANEVLSVAGRTGVVALGVTDVTGAAPLASPVFTGIPISTTVTLTDNSTIIATTAFVKGQNYITSAGAPVQSVAGRTGAVVLTKTDVGLSNVTNNLQVINLGGAPSIMEGTLASRPAAGNVGALYVATDAFGIYRDNGSSWDILRPAISGDASVPANTQTLTLNTVNSNVGTFNNVTVNGKGLVTAASNVAYITGNQTITISGDATGSGTTTIPLTLANSGATAGSYYGGSLTADAKGRITSISSPTAASGFGILTIDNIPIGQTTRASAAFTSVLINGLVAQTISGLAATLTNPTYQATNSVNNYTQISIQNKGAGGSSSADLIAYPDNVASSDLTGFMDLGITGSGFTDASYTITGKTEGYIFMSAPTGSGTSGNMILATDSTGTLNDIIFGTGGFLSANQRMAIKGSSGNVLIGTTTDDGTTKLQVAGNIKATGTISTPTLSGTNTGDQTITLLGDLTGSGKGAFSTTLATVNTTTGAFGTSTTVPTITINGKGLVTASSSTAIAFPVTSVVGRTGAITLTTTDVSEGTNLYYTNARAAAAAPVQTVFGRTGAVSLLSADVTGALGFTPVSTAVVGAANGVATLDGAGKLTAAQIPASLIGAVVYQGTWNASTNTPTLTSGTGTKGYYYKVATAGGTTVDGISSWNVGDTIIYDGTTWDKIDGIANEVLSVAGRTGVVVLTTSDVSEGSNLYWTQARFDTAFSGKSTTNLTEGTNLYFTNARASAAAPVQTVFGRSGTVVLTSADVTGALGFTPYNSTNPANYITSAGAPVQSVAGRTGAVILTKTDVGLSNVVNSLQVINNGGALSLAEGTLATRPAAGNTGAIYFGTDTLGFYRDNGTTWDLVRPAVTGDATSPAGNATLTFNTVNAAPGTFGTATSVSTVTVNAKGLVTTIVNTPITFPVTSVAGKTGVVTLTGADVGLSNVANSLQVINGGIFPTLSSNVLANRPAAGNVGAMFASSDTLSWYRDNGTTWDLMRAPLNGDATILAGQSTITLATVNGSIGTFGTATSVPTITVNAKGLTTTVTSTPIAFPVTSVAGRTGAVVLTKADVGLSNVINSLQIINAGILPQISSNTLATRPAAGTVGAMFASSDTLSWFRDNGTTWDLMHPAYTGDVSSTAGTTLLTLATVNGTVGTFGNATSVPTITVNAKGLATSVTSTAIAFPVTSVAGRTGAVALAVADVNGAAPLASPALTGVPTAPTAATSDNSTTIATTAYVKAAVVASQGAPQMFQVYSGQIAQASGTSTILSTAIPTSASGTLIVTQAVTPPLVTSKYLISFSAIVDSSTSAAVVAVFRGATLIGFGSQFSTAGGGGTAGVPGMLSFSFVDTPGIITAQTYTFRVGIAQAGTWYLGKTASATYNFGGVTNADSNWSIIQVT